MRGKRLLYSALLLGVVALLFAVVVLIPQQLVSPESLTKEQLLQARNDVRSALMQILGGLTAASGAYVVWRKLQDEREVNRKRQELDRAGQITERFTRAIDQLGNENIDVRLGGIYALGRIAQESSADHNSILEVLTAYLREHHSKLAGPKYDWSHYKRTGMPAPDLQAAMWVLGRRRAEYDEPRIRTFYTHAGEVRRPVRLDLSVINMFKLDLRYLDLGEARIVSSDLSQADLTGANLAHSVLQGVDMRARLGGANLRGAILTGVDMGGADLTGADLREVYVEETSLDQAELEGARLQGADLKSAIDVTKEQIASAVVDETTKLPDLMARKPSQEQPAEQGRAGGQPNEESA